MLYIICNPTAGNGRAKKICQDTLAYLQNKNIEFEHVYTKGPGDATVLAQKAAERGFNTVLSVGGDGTIMRYAKIAALYDKPILGINAGRLGFLANLEANQINLISKLKNGDYDTEKRMTLSVIAKENGETVGEFTAVNDAVISSGFMSRLIDVSAYIDYEPITYRADGLIVSTPTGSTAYSMSAGGPIIDPAINNIILTPICSHSLSAKPIILSGDTTVKFKAFSMKKSDVYLLIDGRRCFTIKPYTELYVTKSAKDIKLIKLTKRSFYKTLSEKFK